MLLFSASFPLLIGSNGDECHMFPTLWFAGLGFKAGFEYRESPGVGNT